MITALAVSFIAALTPLAAATTPVNDAAIGTFNRNLQGVSAFVDAGTNINVYGAYRGLKSNRAYFTVIYGNGNCDPAQAFPVGPFTTDAKGRGTLVASVAQPAIVDVGKTGSVSVRRGDDQTDIDGDGLLGSADVVAVAGKPKIGLIECDSSPYTIDAS